MAGKTIVPSVSSEDGDLVLNIGRAYTDRETARFLGISVFVLNNRVRDGELKPIFESGDRRYSGYTIARILGWPLSADPRDYMPATPVGCRHVSNRRAREEAREKAREAARQQAAAEAEREPVRGAQRGSLADAVAYSRQGKSPGGSGSRGPARPLTKREESFSGRGSFAGGLSGRNSLRGSVKRS